jgi:isoleucyl-tRNA synthetase
VAELSAKAGRDLSDLDLHRPYVDDITWVCNDDGCTGTVRRLLPVLDAWFDSGAMPSAQFHYPFAADGVPETDPSVGRSGPERPGASAPRAGDSAALAGASSSGPSHLFEASFPADFICEAIDQTRGWFYSLLAVNTLVFDSTPYRNVVCLGHIVDENGQKMSKTVGNVIDPWTIFAGFGADALRWYFFSAGQPWAARRVFQDGIRESTRQTLVTLWNVFGFFTTYANLDGWVAPADGDAALEPTHVLDRWVLHELEDTITAVTAALEDFDALGGATRLARFVDDLSNWYVRRSRPRFWKASDPAAHATLHQCLVVTAQLLAPFCPFLADELYVTLTGDTSVHVSDWPEPAGRLDPELGADMDAARRLVVLGRAARTDAKVKVRQPLGRALLLHPDRAPSDEVLAEVAAELNVKQLEDVDTLSGLLSWTAQPNFRVLGPRLGPKVNEVKAALAAADGAALRRDLDNQGWVEVAGEHLTADELTLRAERHEQFALAEDSGWAVALDLELDAPLRREGLARELVRSINDLRKETGLAIADRITLGIAADDETWAAIAEHAGYITAEVLAVSLDRIEQGDHRVDLDGVTVEVTLTRAAA